MGLVNEKQKERLFDDASRNGMKRVAVGRPPAQAASGCPEPTADACSHRHWHPGVEPVRRQHLWWV